MKVEAIVLSTIFAALLVLVPVLGGGMGLSWDAVNHQIYLGWIADRSRFDLDVWAAATQSFQFPYLYWPAYKLYSSGAGSMQAGVTLAALQCTCVPAVWMLARVCVPEHSWFGTSMRATAMAMAFASSVILSMFNTTANDLLSAVPLIWAIALASLMFSNDAKPRSTMALYLSVGVLCGVSVAFKLSNGPIAVSVPLLFLVQADGRRRRLAAALGAYVAMLFSFALIYTPWGWELASRFGNPIFPLLNSMFVGSPS
ncbi:MULTISPECIES: hypothetical protein [unclassified Variovorax]|nr:MULTISPECIES: hypothetical protein [unclassified Variovorax]